MEALISWCREQNFEEATIIRLLTEKINANVIHVMKENDLRKYFPAEGDRVLVKEFCKTVLEDTNRKEHLRKEIQAKIDEMKRTHKKRKLDSSQSSNNAVKNTRKVQFGWKNRIGAKVTQVVRKKGGGAHLLEVPKENKKNEMVLIAKNLFFPNGESPFGNVREFDFDIVTSDNRSIDSNQTVVELVEKKQPGVLRLYLLTDQKNDDGDENIPVTVGGDIDIVNDDVIVTNADGADCDDRDDDLLTKLLLEPDRTFPIIIEQDCNPLNEVKVLYTKIITSKYTGEPSLLELDKTEIFSDLQNSPENPVEGINFNFFEPIDFGYKITRIIHNNNVLLNVQTGKDATLYEFPSSADYNPHQILFKPTQLKGFSAGLYGYGTICTCDAVCKPIFTWYRNDELFRREPFFYWLTVNDDATYTCSVSCDAENHSVDSAVDVSSNIAHKDNSTLQNVAVPLESTESEIGVEIVQQLCIPVINRESLKISKIILGSGAQGKVRKGTWLATDVAIKTMRVGKRVSGMDLREINILSSIRHPNIVQIMGVCIESRQLHLVFELVEGDTLGDILFDEDNTIKLDMHTKYNIAHQLLKAIHYLHHQENPIIHQDIKPDNIMITENHLVKVCDLGLARFKQMATLFRTAAGTLKGTPMYMAPEIFLRQEQATTFSDVWSLAATLIELFTEEPVWDDEGNVEEFIQSQMNQCLLPASMKKLPQELQETIQKCFDYTPRNRPSSLDLIAYVSKISASV